MNAFRFTILSLSALISLSACQAKNDSEAAANVKGGRCIINRWDGSETKMILCFKFALGSDSTTGDTQCTTYGNTTYASLLTGGGGIAFTSGDGNNCDTSSTVGNCAISTGQMFYYNNYWSASAAQSDCTATHSGTWATP